MPKAVIVDAIRTPIGKLGGALQPFSAPQLGAMVIREIVSRNGVSGENVDECIMGNVVTAGIGQNPARQASIGGGLPASVPATTVNKVCGSGLKAVMLAADSILADRANTVIAGGMESMSNAPYLLDKARFGYRLFDGTLVDSLVRDGLWDKFNDFHMGVTGEICAERHNVTREDADKFSARSHKLALEATASGRFLREMHLIRIEHKGQTTVIDKDESPRADSTLDRLCKLKPVFKDTGIVTAGNSSSINDGAAALLVMDEDFISTSPEGVAANIVDYIAVGTKPEWLMEAPIDAIRQLLERNKLRVNDIDVFEHNEAFASASVAVQKSLNIPDEKFNIHGGAIALGHPIGASGARVLTTLLYTLKEKNASRGIAALCLGGGEAVAMLVERR